MAKVSAISARMNFENAADLLRAQGLSVESARLTQSYLRAEVAASNSQTVYNFPLLVNKPDPTNFNTQQKLNLQDAFVCAEFGVFLAFPSAATDTNFPLLTWPSPVAAGAAYPSTETLYNGKLTVTLNNNVIVPAWDVLRCKYVPFTQTAGGESSITDSVDFSNDGFYPVEPNLIISGAGNYNVQLVLPQSFGTVVANQRIVLIGRGILAQNVTSVQ